MVRICFVNVIIIILTFHSFSLTKSHLERKHTGILFCNSDFATSLNFNWLRCIKFTKPGQLYLSKSLICSMC